MFSLCQFVVTDTYRFPLCQFVWTATEWTTGCHKIFIRPRCPWGPIYGSWSHSIQDYVADLTDVTLADEDSNLIPTDDVNRAILGNVAMQVAPPGGQNWN